MSALLAAWAIVPEGRTVAAGLMLGTAASLFNVFLLRRRVEFIGKTIAEQGQRRIGLGMAGRLATVLFAVMLAYRFPEHLSLPATLASCFFIQFAVLLTMIVRGINRSDGKG
jgi:ATP synthase protein I